MARFYDMGNGFIYDNATSMAWSKVPTARSLWDDLVPPEDTRVPTLDEMKTLIDGQKAVPEDFAEAFGAGNAPVDWYWVYKIDPAQDAVWQDGSKTPADAEKLSLEKPGHVAAWFNWEGNQPRNRRLIEALCRFIIF